MDVPFLPEKTSEGTVNQAGLFHNNSISSHFSNNKEVYISDLSFSSGMYTSFYLLLLSKLLY
uniref:hypothetical protein n=1 Tax=Coprococcus sp. TaxID=2049024 RepID=UPI0040270EA3